MAESRLDFFSRFIPFHTVDFTSTNEVKARHQITSAFLTRFPVEDAGFEFIVFPRKLHDADLDLQVDNFMAVREAIEREHGTRVHASMHFPTTSNMDLFLGSDRPGVIDRVVSLFDRCVTLAKRAGISVIIVHSGANVDETSWGALAGDRSKKDRALERVGSTLVTMLRAMHDSGYRGKIAWENMPWPFDIPAFTFTNMIVPDFAGVLATIDQEVPTLSGNLGLCFDACHAFILSETARFFKESPGNLTRFVPPGFFPDEYQALVEASDPGCLIDAFTTRVVHLHVADSNGLFSYQDGRVMSRLSEGDELGTGTFTRSGVFEALLDRVAHLADPVMKLGCTLEIKQDDLARPAKTARSLAWLGESFFSTRA